MSFPCRSNEIKENVYVSTHSARPEENPVNGLEAFTPEMGGTLTPSLTPDKSTHSEENLHTKISDNMQTTKDSSLDSKADNLPANTEQPDIDVQTTSGVVSNASLVTSVDIEETAVESENDAENHLPMPSESSQDTSYVRENASVHDTAAEIGGEASPDTTNDKDTNSTSTTDEKASPVVEVSVKSPLTSDEGGAKTATASSTSSDAALNEETETPIPTQQLTSADPEVCHPEPEPHLDTLPEV